MNADERRALLPLVSVARAVLADLEEDEVPSRVVRVAKSSARRLPPPHEQSLIDYIIEDDSFRSDVAQAWAAGDHSDAVVDAFLEDPNAAASILASASEAADADREAREIVRLSARVAQLEARQEQAKARVAEARDRAKQQASEAKAAARRARQGLEASMAVARADEVAARGSLDVALERIELLETEIVDLKARQQRLSDRDSKRHVRAIEPSPQSSSPAGDPIEIARWLDVAERNLRPFREARGGGTPAQAGGGLSLPPGVAPDTCDSIDALAVIPVRTVILDGYNIAGALGVEEFSGAEGRERTLRIARRLHRHTGAETIVMFDAVGIEGRESYTSDLGISVRFTRDVSADDAIADLVGSGITGAVVITNDRELRERGTARGALALWSDALVAWSKT